MGWTQVRVEILLIEASPSASKNPSLTLTGNLGDVMKESATLALGYVKAHAEELEIDPAVFATTSVPIPVPEGVKKKLPTEKKEEPQTPAAPPKQISRIVVYYTDNTFEEFYGKLPSL